MKADALAKALELARGRHVFVATADPTGLPHVGCAGRLARAPDGRLALTEWFCPGTLENVGRNPRLAIVVWDEHADRGYQLLGRVEAVEDLAVLDGYVPQAETGAALPQVERQLLVRVESVLDFHKAPHTDLEE